MNCGKGATPRWRSSRRCANRLVVLDAECRVGLANDAFYALLGETAEQIEGKHIWDTGHGIWAGLDVRRSLQDACPGKQPIVNLEMERSLQGRERTLVLNTKAIVRAERPSLVLLAVADVTDARQAEALRIDAETLRLVDKRKDEFLGILAHELRNPLAPMRFALEIMRRADGNVEKIDAGAPGARPPSHPHGSDRRRSPRCVAHHAGEGGAAQRTAGARQPRQCGRGTLPAGDHGVSAHA